MRLPAVPLRPVRPAGWWFDGVLLAVFVLITVAVAVGWTAGLDEAVFHFCEAHRPAWADWSARGLNLLGQGWVLDRLLGLGLTLLVWWKIRSWRALLPWVAGFVLTYLTVGPLKLWTNRLAPRNGRADAVELFNTVAPGEYAESYPSGHVVNAIVWWTVIIVLASVLWDLSPRLVRWLRFVPPAIVLCTTTYLSFHWITDGLAALALGVVLARLILRVDWPQVLRPPMPSVADPLSRQR
jgi:membrane-associated phospholipid phosphatase